MKGITNMSPEQLDPMDPGIFPDIFGPRPCCGESRRADFDAVADPYALTAGERVADPVTVTYTVRVH